MIALDSSGIYALLNRADPDHHRARRVLEEDPGPYVVPAGILGEITYMVEHRLGPHVLDRLLADLESGALSLDCGDGDLARVRELVGRYADLRLGFSDAAVVACAERIGGRVLTLDRRDFDVVAGEGRLIVLPS